MAAPFFEFREDVLALPQTAVYAGPGKRAFDLMILLVILPVVLPLMVVMLALSALGGGRPFYSQTRVGQDGRTFRCWKFRTMIPDADAALPKLLAENPGLAEEWARTQKLARDPRVTRVGALLRKTSLDELPQLWNVVNGTMSIVGPRPFTPEQRAMYPGGLGAADYYLMRPGMTGLWQVSRRNRGSFAERAAYDTAYWTQIGPIMDLRILLRTVGVVLRGTGV